MIVFRCDGDERVGAGHVARCLQIAHAFAASGAEPVFAGRYSGLAAKLLEAAGMATAPADSSRPAGVLAEAQAAVVDSYELALDEVERAATGLPLAFISDGGGVARGATVLSYHPGAVTGDVLGPDYAPVDPRFASVRHPRGLRRVLATVGGRGGVQPILDEVEEAVAELGDVELERGVGAVGLLELADRADAAVSAAGFTPYELACAGVPMVLVALADNQSPVAEGLARRGMAVVAGEGSLDEGVRRLADPRLRASLAQAGPATVDGLGAYRARDALTAAFVGRPLPPVLRLRPASAEDSALLLTWRNEPDVRAASRNEAEIGAAEHEAWLSATLADLDRVLLVAEEHGRPVGTARFDLRGGAAEVSVIVSPGCRGRGLGSRLVRQACELLLAAHTQVGQVLAEVRVHNRRSVAAFERAGFRPAPAQEVAGSVMLALDRRGLASAS